jgi:hypothetical protein
MAVPVMMLTVASSASAARPLSVHKFTGSISCSVSGKITSTPGLQLATAQTVKIRLAVTLTGCTGTHLTQDHATITGGSASSSITGSYSCESLLEGLPNVTGEVKWTTTGTNTAAATKYTMSDGTLTAGSPDTVSYTSAQTGSFSGSGTFNANVKQSTSQLEAKCESATGLKTVNLSSGTMSLS